MRKLLSRVFALLALQSIILASCSSIKSTEQVLFVQKRDLIKQSQEGNGEGLAKGVPGQPLLINNQLVFSTMGDAVLGISIATGAIKKTIDLFQNMSPLLMEQWTQQALDQQSNSSQWNVLLNRLSHEKQRLIVSPYAYLNGHPHAVLEVRLHVSLMDDISGVVWSSQLYERSDRLPLEGGVSWSADNGERIINFSREHLPLLVAKLPALVK